MPTGVKRDFDHYIKASGECLLWTGSVSSSGYGNIRRDGVNTTAHRFAWERERGPIPAGQVIAHHCDNKLCVNVAHLFLASQFENMRDCVNKGRHSRGATHGRAKLADATVAEIRAAAKRGEPQAAIAKRFGVNQSYVSKVVNWHLRAQAGRGH